MDLNDAFSTLELIGLGFYDLSLHLNRIEHMLDHLTHLEHTEMADLTRITADVTANTDAVASAVTLLNELATEIRNAGTDPAALDALATQIETNSAQLADAVTANTTPPAPPAG